MTVPGRARAAIEAVVFSQPVTRMMVSRGLWWFAVACIPVSIALNLVGTNSMWAWLLNLVNVIVLTTWHPWRRSSWEPTDIHQDGTTCVTVHSFYGIDWDDAPPPLTRWHVCQPQTRAVVDNPGPCPERTIERCRCGARRERLCKTHRTRSKWTGKNSRGADRG